MKRRKDGRYQKRVTVSMPNGERKTVLVYGKTEAECRRKADAIALNLAYGRKFEDVALCWFEEHSENLAPNSLKNYRPALNRAIEAFGHLKMTDLTPSKISAFTKRMSVGFADKTVRNQLMVINLICIYAINAGDIDTNPADNVRIPRNLPKERVHSPERNTLLKIIDSVDDPFGFLPFLALHTGLRRGELLALEYSDFRNGEIVVNKSLYWQYGKAHIKAPKTEAGIRTVPILPAVLPYINKKKGLVFPSPRGDYLTEGEFQARIKAYKRRTGIEFTVHQLRHAYATMLYENDISPKDAQGLLGHAQISTTLDIYTDISNRRKKEVFDRLKTASF